MAFGRSADLGAYMDLGVADLPANPVEYTLFWRENGLVCCLVQR